MKNVYGVMLDRNRYAPSIVGEADRCFICGRSDRKLERHEVYHGAYRDKSKQLGCWVQLCNICHDKLHHKGGGLDEELKAEMQPIVMEYYSWSAEDFRREFGKSYV